MNVDEASPTKSTPLDVELSIIVASVESAQTMETALRALHEACRGLTHEILVVDASRDGSAGIAEEDPDVVLIRRPPGTLAPELWATGIRASRGRSVALTTGHCVVGPGWASALLDALESGAAAVGGGLLPAPGIRSLDDAVFFLRYSGFLSITRGAMREVVEVPGDNAAYRGEALRRHLVPDRSGFWEVEFHRELRAQGERIVAEPRATVRFGRAFPLPVIAAQRFRHGRHFGAWRTSEGGESRLRVAGPAPLVPLVLVFRTARRVRGQPSMRNRFVRALPWFFVLAASWAAGEAAGAILGARS